LWLWLRLQSVFGSRNDGSFFFENLQSVTNRMICILELYGKYGILYLVNVASFGAVRQIDFLGILKVSGWASRCHCGS